MTMDKLLRLLNACVRGAKAGAAHTHLGAGLEKSQIAALMTQPGLNTFAHNPFGKPTRSFDALLVDALREALNKIPEGEKNKTYASVIAEHMVKVLTEVKTKTK